MLERIFLRNYAWSLAAQAEPRPEAAYNRAIFRVAIFLTTIAATVMAGIWATAVHFDVNPVAHRPSILYCVIGAMAFGVHTLLHRHFASYATRPEAATRHDSFADLLWLYAETAGILLAIVLLVVLPLFWGGNDT